jgi:hypothetical protein
MTDLAPAVEAVAVQTRDYAAEEREPQTRAAILETTRAFDAEALARALNRLADAGWNSIVLPGFLHGYPVFPSDVWGERRLPSQHPAFRKWNPLEVAFDTAWRRKLDILIAVAPYLVEAKGGEKPPILRRYPKWAAAQHPGRRRQRSTPASPPRAFYCPVNPEARRFMCDMLYVLAESYPFHGLLIDLRHYPFYSEGESPLLTYCYCEACRNATLRDLGFDPANLDFGKEEAMVARWRDWQAEQMDQAMAYIRMRALKARGTMRILGLLTTDSGLQPGEPRPRIHWRTWAERALVEALVLDRYATASGVFEEQLKADLEMLPASSLLLPMLPRKAADSQGFLDVYARHPVPGFATRFENWDLPDFDPQQRAPLDTPAFSVEADPIYSVCVLFDRMAKAAPLEEDFGGFLGDLSTILRRTDVRLTVARVLMVADNVRGLRERVLAGQLDLGSRREQILRDLDLAARLVYLAGCDLVE